MFELAAWAVTAMFLHIFRFQGGGSMVPSRRIAFAAALLSGYSGPFNVEA